MGQLITVAEANDIPPGTAKEVEAEGRRIALFNSGDGYYAIDGVCTHRGGRRGQSVEATGWAASCYPDRWVSRSQPYFAGLRASG